MKFKVENIDDMGDFIRVTVSTVVNKETKTQTYKFTEEQMETDKWKGHVEMWVRQLNKGKIKLKKIKGRSYTVKVDP